MQEVDTYEITFMYMENYPIYPSLKVSVQVISITEILYEIIYKFFNYITSYPLIILLN